RALLVDGSYLIEGDLPMLPSEADRHPGRHASLIVPALSRHWSDDDRADVAIHFIRRDAGTGSGPGPSLCIWTDPASAFYLGIRLNFLWFFFLVFDNNSVIK